jgi:hypothetical protein
MPWQPSRGAIAINNGEVMALLRIPSDADASPEQAVLFRHTKQILGRVANAIRVASHSPKIAQSIVGLIVPALREEITNNLPVRTKVLVILKTSTLNACRY